MLAQICVQFLLIFISTLIPLILSQCSNEVNNCFIKFSSNLETHKRHPFISIDNEINDICDQTNGLYFKFIHCITGLEHQCSTDPNFKQYLCETRKLKMRINRFNWKPTFFHYLCQNVSSDSTQGFIKHEECISNVFNTQKWKCDVNYDKPIKALKSWRNSRNTTCSLWRKFRDCGKNDVKHKCGVEASNISDQLFHTHQSYFEKYNSCELEGQSDDHCWYELLKSQSTSAEASLMSTTSDSTQVTNDITVSNIESNKSIELISSEHNSSLTKSLEMKTQFQTLNDSNDLSDEESHETIDQLNRRSDNQSISDLKLNDNRDDMLYNSEGNGLEIKGRKKLNDENTEQLTATSSGAVDENANQVTSGATTEATDERYLLVLPLVLILFIKYLI